MWLKNKIIIMGLNNFFTINFPYGIQRNEHGQWCAFNREYKPLGFNDRIKRFNFENYPLYTNYENFNIENILNLVQNDVRNFHIDNNGNIKKIFFYNDATNPSKKPEYMNNYIKIVTELSKLVRVG